MLKGFFFKQETEGKKKRVKTKTITKKAVQIEDPCEICGLYKKCKSPKMKPSGDGELGILIVGEAGGKTEDARGTQFIGQAGTFLREVLSEFGLDLDKHFWKTNALICPTRDTPTKKQLKLCRPNLEKTIQELKPKFIWLMGTKAVESYYLGRFSDVSISKWRRLCIPEPSIGSYIIPLFHPSYVIRNKSRELEGTFRRDIKWALSCLSKPRPKKVEVENKVRILKDIDEMVDHLEYIAKRKDLKIAFDYETTGLKPYAKGHKILTVSVCYDKEFAIAFPYQYGDVWTRKEFKQIETLWKKILMQNPKIAHNLKYEHKWSSVIIGVEPRNWIWDTMVTSHILDCNKPTGLKFQSYINFGIEGYEKEVQKYMKTDNSHSINKLEQFDLDKLLIYNGIDSLVTYWLYEKQRSLLRGGLKRANKFFLAGLKALADVEQNGICADEKYYEKMDLELSEKIAKLETDIYDLEEVKLFEEQEGREININSGKDLKILLYDILKVEPTKFTNSGEASTDHEALAQLNTDFTSKLIELRKLRKIRDTYLAQFKREIINSKIYPGFNLHIARTFRSSSDSPNFQNIPVRDEYAKKVTRSGLIPTKGNRILEVDYSSIEVRIAACYTRDPVLVKYINDPSSDMHRDTAKELFLLDDKQVTKKIRFYAKNCFVFPEFYGSWYKNCAANLWENVVEAGLKTGEGILVRDHLKNHGIRSYKDFEEHVRQVEENFWDRFKIFKEWQEYVIDFYNRKGYVEMFFGHRRIGYLTKNMIINSPIQGTAFHCLLWSLIRLNEIRRREGWKTKLVGQIHDSIVSDLCPEEQDYVLDMFRKVMCEDIREEFDWIIVPLDIEYEMTKIDHPWYEKRETIKDYVQLENKVEEMWVMLEDKEHGILATTNEPEVVKKGKVWQVVS